MEDLKRLSVSELKHHLSARGISSKSLENVTSGMISGLALVLLDDSELKEVFPIIGDRAVIRNIIHTFKQPKKDEVQTYSNSNTPHTQSPLNATSACDQTDKQPAGSYNGPYDINLDDIDENTLSQLLQTSEDGVYTADCANSSFSWDVEHEEGVVPSKKLDLIDKDISENNPYEAATPQLEPPITPTTRFENGISLKRKRGKDSDHCNGENAIERNSQKQTKLEEIQGIRRLSQRKQEKPLPNPFQLPENFPSTVEAALLKKALFGHARTKFLTVVAQSIYFHKRYPTNEEYFHVVQRIFEKWPFLNVNGLSGYVNLLRMRMAYLRKPDDQKRGNKSLEYSKKNTTPQKPKSPSLPLVAPVISFGEDEASMQKHYNMLERETGRSVPRKTVVAELMKRTFPLRRKEILSEDVCYSKILTMYPALANPTQILLEFDRIHEKNVTEECIEKWSQLVMKVMKINKEEGENSKAMSLLVRSDTKVTEELHHVITIITLIDKLPDVRCQIDYKKIITVVDNDFNMTEVATGVSSPQPCLIACCVGGEVKQCYVVIEKKILCSVNIDVAVLVMFCSFFVFNMHYTSGCTNLYTFFEYLFLDTCVPKRKPRISSFISQLNVTN